MADVKDDVKGPDINCNLSYQQLEKNPKLPSNEYSISEGCVVCPQSSKRIFCQQQNVKFLESNPLIKIGNKDEVNSKPGLKTIEPSAYCNNCKVRSLCNYCIDVDNQCESCHIGANLARNSLSHPVNNKREHGKTDSAIHIIPPKKDKPEPVINIFNIYNRGLHNWQLGKCPKQRGTKHPVENISAGIDRPVSSNESNGSVVKLPNIGTFLRKFTTSSDTSSAGSPKHSFQSSEPSKTIQTLQRINEQSLTSEYPSTYPSTETNSVDAKESQTDLRPVSYVNPRILDGSLNSQISTIELIKVASMVSPSSSNHSSQETAFNSVEPVNSSYRIQPEQEMAANLIVQGNHEFADNVINVNAESPNVSMVQVELKALPNSEERVDQTDTIYPFNWMKSKTSADLMERVNPQIPLNLIAQHNSKENETPQNPVNLMLHNNLNDTSNSSHELNTWKSNPPNNAKISVNLLPANLENTTKAKNSEGRRIVIEPKVLPTSERVNPIISVKYGHVANLMAAKVNQSVTLSPSIQVTTEAQKKIVEGRNPAVGNIQKVQIYSMSNVNNLQTGLENQHSQMKPNIVMEPDSLAKSAQRNSFDHIRVPVHKLEVKDPINLLSQLDSPDKTQAVDQTVKISVNQLYSNVSMNLACENHVTEANSLAVKKQLMENNSDHDKVSTACKIIEQDQYENGTTSSESSSLNNEQDYASALKGVVLSIPESSDCENEQIDDLLSLLESSPENNVENTNETNAQAANDMIPIRILRKSTDNADLTSYIQLEPVKLSGIPTSSSMEKRIMRRSTPIMKKNKYTNRLPPKFRILINSMSDTGQNTNYSQPIVTSFSESDLANSNTMMQMENTELLAVHENHGKFDSEPLTKTQSQSKVQTVELQPNNNDAQGQGQVDKLTAISHLEDIELRIGSADQTQENQLPAAAVCDDSLNHASLQSNKPESSPIKTDKGGSIIQNMPNHALPTVKRHLRKYLESCKSQLSDHEKCNEGTGRFPVKNKSQDLQNKPLSHLINCRSNKDISSVSTTCDSEAVNVNNRSQTLPQTPNADKIVNQEKVKMNEFNSHKEQGRTVNDNLIDNSENSLNSTSENNVENNGLVAENNGINNISINESDTVDRKPNLKLLQEMNIQNNLKLSNDQRSVRNDNKFCLDYASYYSIKKEGLYYIDWIKRDVVYFNDQFQEISEEKYRLNFQIESFDVTKNYLFVVRYGSLEIYYGKINGSKEICLEKFYSERMGRVIAMEDNSGNYYVMSIERKSQSGIYFVNGTMKWDHPKCKMIGCILPNGNPVVKTLNNRFLVINGSSGIGINSIKCQFESRIFEFKPYGLLLTDLVFDRSSREKNKKNKVTKFFIYDQNLNSQQSVNFTETATLLGTVDDGNIYIAYSNTRLKLFKL